MKKLQKVLSLFIIILSATLLCSCANVQCIRLIDTNGVIQDKVVIELDDELTQNGFSISEISQSIVADFQVYLNDVNEWKNEFLPYGLDYYNYVNQGIVIEILNVGKKVSLTTTFASSELFSMFYGITEIENDTIESNFTDYNAFLNGESKPIEDVNPFIYKYGIIESNSFINNIENEKYGLNVPTTFYQKYMTKTANTFGLDDINFSQIFGVCDNRYYANADEVETVANMTLFYWNLNSNDTDFVLELYRLNPNTPAWYIVALAITFTIIIALFVIYIVTSKTRRVRIVLNEQGTDMNNKNDNVKINEKTSGKQDEE